MGALTIEMNGLEAIAMMTSAGAGLPAVLTKQLGLASILAKATMREKAPVGVGGDKDGLKGSIGVTLIPEALSSEIKPTMPYADAVETGSKPHWIPHGPDSALAAWAKLKGINVYALAASIAKKGTKPHPYIEPTYEEVAPGVIALFASGVDAFLGGLFV